MWKLLIVLALPLAPMAAAHTMAAADATDIECEIRASPPGGDGVELEAVVATGTPLSGTYEFDVRKEGPAGISSSAQSGTFNAVSGQSVVGHVNLGLETGATYDAELVVRSNGEEATCTASGPEG